MVIGWENGRERSGHGNRGGRMEGRERGVVIGVGEWKGENGVW